MNGLCKNSPVVGMLLTASIVIGCSTPPALDASRQFQEAEQAFADAVSEEQFAAAASKYQTLINSGLHSGAVFYNQGNAWMRAGKTGHAIASYRQAQRLRPRDPYLIANLQNALNVAGSAATIDARSGIAGYLFFWQHWLSYPEKFVLTTILLRIALVTATVARLMPRPPGLSRTLLFRFASVAGLLFVLSAVSTAWDWQRFDNTVHGVVISKEVIARKGNAQTYEPAFTESLPQGTEFTLLDRRSNWLQIVLQDAQSAWIPERSAFVY